MLGIGVGTRDALLEGSEHRYSCRCITCLRWWAEMGAEPDGGGHGPFTAEEVAKERQRIGR